MIAARGSLVISVMLVCIVVAAILYTKAGIEGAISRHDSSGTTQTDKLRKAIDRQTCVTLYDFKERQYFREKDRQGYINPWKQMCPWMED